MEGLLDKTKSRPKMKLTKKALKEHYPEIVELIKVIPHEIVVVGDVWRFKENSIVRYLCDEAPFYTPSSKKAGYGSHSLEQVGSVSLNGLWIDFHDKKFEIEDFMKFYMGLGYSLCGFLECFGQREAFDFGYSDAKPPQGGDYYTQTLIDYVIAKHKKRKK